jgi:LacI family transcriptional regulator
MRCSTSSTANVIRGFQTEAQRLGYQVLLHMYDRETEGLDTLRRGSGGSR